MLYLAELYTSKPAWEAMGQEQRDAFLTGIGSAMPDLQDRGVEPIAFGEIDSRSPYAASQAFFGLWRCRNRKAFDALLAGIAASGWHEYFETTNAGGTGVGLAEHVHQLMALRS